MQVWSLQDALAGAEAAEEKAVHAAYAAHAAHAHDTALLRAELEALQAEAHEASQVSVAEALSSDV